MRNPFARVVEAIANRFAPSKPKEISPYEKPQVVPEQKQPSLLNTIKQAIARATKRNTPLVPDEQPKPKDGLDVLEFKPSEYVQKPKPTTQITQQDILQTAIPIDIAESVKKTLENGSLTQLNKDIAKKEFLEDVQQAIEQNSEEIRQKYYKYARRETDDENPPKFSDLILANVNALIAQYIDSEREQFAYGAKLLKTALDQQIEAYGYYKVAMSLEQAPHEAIASAQITIFASTQEQKEQGLTRFLQIIKGEVLSLEETKAIGEALDNDDGFGYII